MRATPLRSGFQAIVVLLIYTASVFRRRFALYVTCAGFVSLLKFIILNLNLQWSCSKVHSTLMGTNNRARIKITAERIALYYDRGLAFWNTFILRINTSLLRISQFTELKYSTNQ